MKQLSGVSRGGVGFASVAICRGSATTSADSVATDVCRFRLGICRTVWPAPEPTGGSDYCASAGTTGTLC